MLIEITYNVTDVYMSTTETPVYVEISFEQPGSASAVWGSITGTLSNQTDLQNALNAKFDDPTGTTLQYIDGTGALQTFPLTLPVLQEVRNQTGATLDAGTVVYINGATGNKPTVTKAIATGDATSAQTLGMISAAIANNGVGYVVVIGTCGGLDTSAYTEGQQLYLSGTVAGGVTTTKPYAPIHLVYVGIVTRAHPNLGTVEVRVQNGFEMDEIHNVSAQTPSNNDGLFYNTSTSLWESKSITTALGYTPVPTTRNITINGVTYDLSADRTWTIAAGISGSGASGQVTYWTGASAVTGSADFTWDGNNLNLASAKGITLQRTGTNRNINIVSTNIADDFAGATFYPSSGTNVSTAFSVVPRGAGLLPSVKTAIDLFFTDYISNTTNWELGTIRASSTAFILTTAKGGTGVNRPILLASGYGTDNATNANQLWLYANGNVGINTSSDLGVRFGVVGDTLLRGSGATSATTALTVQNSSSTNLFVVRNDGSVGIGTNAPTDILDIRKDQVSTTIATTTSMLLTNANASGIAAYVFTSDGTTRQGGLQYNNTTGFRNLFSCTYTNIPYYFGTNSSIRLTITGDTGNVMVGTTTDLGVRFGVSGDTLLRGSGATSATTALTVQNSSSTNLLTVRNDGFTTIGTTTQGLQTVNATISSYLICNSSIGAVFGSYTSFNSKAVLQCDSTTKGFLPPRMTTTQKNAITTPPAGLVVYDTDLNKLCVYTTAWETITSI